MIKQFLLSCMAIGILAGGIYNDACATNAPTEQAAGNQQISKGPLTANRAKELIEQMKARGSTKLEIDEGYTAIKSLAFSGYKEVTSVIIPDSVTSIG